MQTVSSVNASENNATVSETATDDDVTLSVADVFNAIANWPLLLTMWICLVVAIILWLRVSFELGVYLRRRDVPGLLRDAANQAYETVPTTAPESGAVPAAPPPASGSSVSSSPSVSTASDTTTTADASSKTTKEGDLTTVRIGQLEAQLQKLSTTLEGLRTQTAEQVTDLRREQSNASSASRDPASDSDRNTDANTRERSASMCSACSAKETLITTFTATFAGLIAISLFEIWGGTIDNPKRMRSWMHLIINTAASLSVAALSFFCKKFHRYILSICVILGTIALALIWQNKYVAITLAAIAVLVLIGIYKLKSKAIEEAILNRLLDLCTSFAIVYSVVFFLGNNHDDLDAPAVDIMKALRRDYTPDFWTHVFAFIGLFMLNVILATTHAAYKGVVWCEDKTRTTRRLCGCRCSRVCCCCARCSARPACCSRCRKSDTAANADAAVEKQELVSTTSTSTAADDKNQTSAVVSARSPPPPPPLPPPPPTAATAAANKR